MTLSHLQAALSPSELVALTLAHENGFRGVDADRDRACLAAVIRNRVVDGRWGPTVREVLLARKQFSCWNPSTTDKNHLALRRRGERWVKGTTTLSVLEQQCFWLAEGVGHGVIPDVAFGACHYHTHASAPTWSRGQTPVLKTRYHRYFAGIA